MSTSLRALHLFSNHKWTGPAEPAVLLALALRARGVEVTFRSSGHTKGGASGRLAEQAAARGLAPVVDLHLSKHRKFWLDLPDSRRLRGIVEREGFDLVHCHLPNDTRIAERALRGLGRPLLRSLYATEPESLSARDAELLRRAARRVFVFARGMERALLERGFEKRQLVHLEAAVDLERFRPGGEVLPLRRRFGFSAQEFVVGLVARVQPQRRFDLLLDAAERAARDCPRLRLLVIGRGSKLERTAREPARRRGLLDRTVFFPGYFEGPEYPAALRALDAKLFLVPGSDGTARAVREALACGVPVIATRRGVLPELVQDGVTGRVVDESPEALARALVELARDESGRRRMGVAAHRDACQRFDPRRQAALVGDAYRSAIEEGP